MKLSLLLLTKDVGRIVGEAIESIKPYLYELVVVDTGSTDDTEAVVLRAFPAAKILKFTQATHPQAFLLDAPSTWEEPLPGPFTGEWFLGDFAAARRFGWREMTGDYLMWIDSDDVVVGAAKLPAAICTLEENKLDGLYLAYDYSVAGENIECRIWRERIVKRTSNIDWYQPIHEALRTSDGKFQEFSDELRVVHKNRGQGTPKIAHRNLKAALRFLSPDNARDNFYLGQETRNLWPTISIAFYNRCRDLSRFDEERAAASAAIGALHERRALNVQGAEREARFGMALTEYTRAMVEFPWNPDHWFALARVHYYKQDWRKVIEYTDLGWAVEYAPTVPRRPFFVVSPYARRYAPHVYMAEALDKMGVHNRSIVVCNEALKTAPIGPAKAILERVRKTALAQTSIQPQLHVAQLEFSADEPLTAPAPALKPDVLALFAVQLWKTFRDAPAAARFLASLPEQLQNHPKIVEAKRLSV